MKAVFLLQTDPYRPKPSLRALREADTLVSAGWDVAFVSWIKGTVADDGDSPFRVVRIPVPVPPLGSSFPARARAYTRATAAIANAGATEKPDLIVAHDFEVLRAGVRLRHRTDVPLIYDSHEDWPALIAENSALEARIAKFQEARYCRFADHVLTVSEPIAAKFRKLGRPTSVLYNARPTVEVQRADREASRARFGYDRTDFVVGFAGALGKGRGLDVLLQSLSRLSASVKALIVGGPESEADPLRRQSTALRLVERVRVDGYRPFAELAPYYAAMDVGVILLEPWPNHMRALPNKLFDYMANGVAVIVPDYPAMGPIVREAVAGWTLGTVEPQSVAAAIEAARASQEWLSRGNRGRDAYLRQYAWDRQVRRFLTVVSDLVLSAELD